MNTTEFIIVNFYIINRSPAFVPAHSLYPALRVVSPGLQPNGGAQRDTDHEISYSVAFRMQSGDLLSLINFAAVIFPARSFIF